MSDLISRSALLEDFAERQKLDRSDGDYADCFVNDAQELSTEWWCVEDAVESAPAVDAVPVVRCRECKHRGDTYECPMRRLVLPFDGAGHYEDFTTDDGYCHKGVKKEDHDA